VSRGRATSTREQLGREIFFGLRSLHRETMYLLCAFKLFGSICRTLDPQSEYLKRVASASFLFIDLDYAPCPHQTPFTLGLS
jgi:hypothetical protein